jgi:hypothetical protein
MKLFTIILAVMAIVATGFCSVASAKNLVETTEKKWRFNPMPYDKDYSGSYGTEITKKDRLGEKHLVEDCIIFVKRDGSGLIIFANRYGFKRNRSEKGVWVMHTIVISSITRIQEHHISVKSDTNAKPIDYPYFIGNEDNYPDPRENGCENGYFVFQDFLHRIQLPEFPDNVRKMFHGCCGVK